MLWNLKIKETSTFWERKQRLTEGKWTCEWKEHWEVEEFSEDTTHESKDQNLHEKNETSVKQTWHEKLWKKN